MRRYVAAVAALLLLLAPVAGMMATADSVVVSVPLRYTVFESSVSVAANSSYSINVSSVIPNALRGYINDVKVIVVNASGTVKLHALDANGSTLATADVVPLSTAYQVTLPNTTAVIQLGSAKEWSGTVKIVVESTIKFDVNMPDKIVVKEGTGEGTAHIKEIAGPPGQIYLIELNPNFDVKFKDPTPEYSGDDFVETNGTGWEADVPVVVTAGNVQPGTYNVNVEMWFKVSDKGTNVMCANLSLALDIGTGGGGNGGDSNHLSDLMSKLKNKEVMIGIGVGVIALLLIAFMVAGHHGHRRGMASLKGEVFIVLMMMLVAVIGVTITMLDKTMALALGVGVAAFMVLLIFMSAGKIKVAGRG